MDPSTDGSTAGAAPNGRSLFDGFEGYLTATDDNFRAVLTNGMIVLDTNVLLNLYRYNPDARRDFFAVLDVIKARIWIPHQVASEFWKNRESASSSFDAELTQATKELQQNKQQTIDLIARVANRVSLPADRKSQLNVEIERAFEATRHALDSLKKDDINRLWDTNNDPVLKRIMQIIGNSVGSPLSHEEHAAVAAEGLRRMKEDRPPGFKDKRKNGDLNGDHMVWHQTIIEAKRRKCDVLIVTGDVKEDWWLPASGGSQPRGPRPELVDELRERADVRLLMLRPEALLRHAKATFDIKVDDASVEAVERVAELEASSVDSEKDVIVSHHHPRSMLYNELITASGSILMRAYGQYLLDHDWNLVEGTHLPFDIVAIKGRRILFAQTIDCGPEILPGRPDTAARDWRTERKMRAFQDKVNSIGDATGSGRTKIPLALLYGEFAVDSVQDFEMIPLSCVARRADGYWAGNATATDNNLVPLRF